MAKDLNEKGAENQTEGAAKEFEGKVRGTAGDLTDDQSEQLNGKAKELEGKTQRKFGESQDDLAE